MCPFFLCSKAAPAWSARNVREEGVHVSLPPTGCLQARNRLHQFKVFYHLQQITSIIMAECRERIRDKNCKEKKVQRKEAKRNRVEERRAPRRSRKEKCGCCCSLARSS
jgi:hypothetical protein